MLGASNLTYAEATWTQTLPDWTGADVRMFRFFGGAPKLLVPDNLKSGVAKASFYDPEINRTYGAMAAHYSVGILPARPRRPRDKAKVEAGVRFAQTYILGRLRALTFFSLAECNAAIALVMQRMNERPMRNLGLSRRELFEAIERDVLIALPADDWEFAEWRRARVNLDYHIEVHDCRNCRMLSSRFAGIPISSSTIDGPGVPQLPNRGEQTMIAVTGSGRPASFRNGGRDQIGTVADIKSESLAGLRRNSQNISASSIS